MTNPTLIAAARTYDEKEAASTGYDVQILSRDLSDPGSCYALLTSHSNWCGTSTDDRYKATVPDYVYRAALREFAGETHPDDDFDLEAAIHHWLAHDNTGDWVCIRRGRVIR